MKKTHIAAVLHVHKSTITREFQRNMDYRPKGRHYFAAHAQKKTEKRYAARRVHYKFTPEMQEKARGFFKWLRKTSVVIMWLYVWFYMGWGNNYYRTGLYERNGIQRVSYEPEAFRHFLREYTRELNRSAAQTGICDRKKFEQEVRAFYCSEMTRYGYTSLHNWQHVKAPLLNGVFSAVLVQGYMVCRISPQKGLRSRCMIICPNE